MERYQDYVIRDGKFVGHFEEMYSKFDDPWLQSQPEHHRLSYSRKLTLLQLERFGVRSVVEFGCGLGYYTDMIRRHLRIDVLGVDVSETAIQRARELWPETRFAVDTVSNIDHYSPFDAIVFAEITWYILDQVDQVFEKMMESHRGRLFFHNLVFYKGHQRYGLEYFSTLEEFIRRVPFKLLGSAQVDMTNSDTIETSCVFEIAPK